MGIELNEIIEKAKRLAEREKIVKEQPINGNYRNVLYYQNVFKQVGAEEAYNIVATNIKNKTFKYEVEVAIREYEKFYGVPFMSKEERKANETESELERVKKELEEMKAVKAEVAKTVVDEEKKAIDPTDFPTGMDKEAFKTFFIEWFTKSQGVAPTKFQWGKAYAKYAKDNEIKV